MRIISLLFVFILILPTIHVNAQTVLPSLSSLSNDWNVIKTNGLCSSGTPYQFYVRHKSDNNRLLIFFNGGGACWFGAQCNLEDQPNTHSPFADQAQQDPRKGYGIFALNNSENPFAEYNIVTLPYCTGDGHVGGGLRTYSYTNNEGRNIEVPTYHYGYNNSMTVLNWVYENFPSPDRIVVAGSSAGAIGSSFYSGLIAENYSKIPVVLLVDAAGGYGSPNLSTVFKAWNTTAILPNWREYIGETNETLNFEDFYIASKNHNTNLTIAQYNTLHDEAQINFTLLLGDPPDSFAMPQRILHHYAEIESAVDNFYSYSPGGKVHTILTSPIFYSYKVEGVRFVDWVKDLIEGKTVEDISCVDEPKGCADSPQ